MSRPFVWRIASLSATAGAMSRDAKVRRNTVASLASMPPTPSSSKFMALSAARWRDCAVSAP
jgi:hypothetical protein